MQQQDNCFEDVYKDVVIIGNGPSGICLSYLLAGNWPHYTGEAHPCDEMLTARLRYSVATQSCSTDEEEEEEEEKEKKKDEEEKEGEEEEEEKKKKKLAEKMPNGVDEPAHPVRRKQRAQGPKDARSGRRCFANFSRREDLECLSAGLEGRNNGKPLSLFMDQLQHPCLDAGLDVPSLLEWKSPEEHSKHKVIDHVVLGKGPPGGAWHTLDPNILTISLKRWMSLPGLDLQQWESSLNAEEKKQIIPYLGKDIEIGTNYNSTRVPIGIVAAYYKDYVTKQGLEKFFRCGTVVTSVKSIPGVPNNENEYGWLVQGYENETNQHFQYRCKRIILATGTTDSSNRLGVSGENTYNWVTHDFKEFERKLDQSISQKMNYLRSNIQINDRYSTIDMKSSSEPVLIVGSGLSAADAIMAARFRGISVLHVFRNNVNDRNDKSDKKRSLDRLQWLPASMYPEYHKIYEMMADSIRNYPLYKSLSDHVVVGFSMGANKYTRSKTRKVTLCTSQGRLISYRVSFAAVLIGSKPDLSYLENNGIGLGKLQDKLIDSRSNQIDVNVFTYQVERAPRKGLYAIGPLAGDNFVRFILGGAFGVLANILNPSE